MAERSDSFNPVDAGEICGRLWGYLHRRRTIQRREITPAAAEYLRRIQHPDAFNIGEYTHLFHEAFRHGVTFWGKVERDLSQGGRRDRQADHTSLEATVGSGQETVHGKGAETRSEAQESPLGSRSLFRAARAAAP